MGPRGSCRPSIDLMHAPPSFSLAPTAQVNSLIMSVGYCHKSKLVHRDLKPENVLLEKDGNYDFAGLRIIDFGFACWEKKKGDRFDECLGSLEYVSPQVLQSNYGRGCDVWSVGVITYVLLAGHPPFNGAADGDIMKAIQKGTFTFRGPKWDNISEECKDFIQQLLTFEEDARPAAEKALQHKWLIRMRKRQRQEHYDGEIWQSLTEALQALERFRSRDSKLKQATSVLLATQFMTKKDRQHIDPLFRELDGHCHGSISMEDLHDAFWFTDFAGESRTEEHVKDIMKEVNFSKSGSITYSEFAAVVMLETGLVDKERLRAVFDYYDTALKGDIDRHDLAKVLFPDRSSRSSESLCRKIIAETTDHKYISFSTFKKIMLPSSRESQRSSRSERNPVEENWERQSNPAVVA
jgi:calcium-dependent protein kinase